MRQDNHIYAAMIENLDNNFGRVIDFLKNNGLYENTIIVFTSDHGGPVSYTHLTLPTSR